MHPTTAKLISLERGEALVTFGWPKGAQPSLREQAKPLRGELPPHILNEFDRLKAEGKEPVGGVFHHECGECHAPLSKAALARLRQETEVSRCEHCTRFVYWSDSLESHNQHVGAKGTRCVA
jgi:hypothetical protein